MGISHLLSASCGSVGGGNRFGFGGLDARYCVCGIVADVYARCLWFGYFKLKSWAHSDYENVCSYFSGG